MQHSRLLACLARTRICVAGTTCLTLNSIDSNTSNSNSSEGTSKMEHIAMSKAVKDHKDNSLNEINSSSLPENVKDKRDYKAEVIDNKNVASNTNSSTKESAESTEKMTSTSNSKQNTESTTIMSFTKITVQPWQKLMIDNADDRNTIPSSLLFFGKQLGPRPLFILDHSLPDPAMKLASQLDKLTTTGVNNKSTKTLHTNEEDNVKKSSDKINGSVDEAWDKDAMLTHAAHKYEPMLSHLSWPYGVIYIPLWLDAASLHVPHLLYDTCRMVSAVMDAFDVRWSHFLTHSYGALVAARLAASRFFLHRIGTFISLDSPLITETAMRNAALREEIHAAEEDVNVPQESLAYAKEQLMSNLETDFPCAATDYDQLLFDKYFFNRERNFSRNGLDYDEHHFVPVRELRHLHHPMQFITPSSKPVMDIKAHKEFFQLRRLATIKTAKEHNDLFAPAAAEEVAAVLDNWLHRFEPDKIIQRRYNQAAKELAELINSDSSSVQKDDGQPRADAHPRKKKEKKKKVVEKEKHINNNEQGFL